MSITTVGAMGVTALLLALLVMPLMIRLSVAVNAVDSPDARKEHTTAMPLLGGIVIAIFFALSCLLFLPIDPVLKAFMIGLGIITLSGLIDDIWHIRPALKFIGEIAASLVFVLLSDTVIDSFGDLVGTGPINTGVFAIPITVFCMVGVVNALNFTDGLDGLAGGLSAIACLFLAYFAILSDQWLSLAIITALFGSLIGFLYYNMHPARVFMGDTGSQLLGYALSAICILLVQKSNGALSVAPVSMAIILGLPIVDTLLVMTNRMAQGKSPFLPDKTHLHYRLLSLGLKHPGVVWIMYAAMVTCGLLAVFVRNLPEWQQFATGILYAGLLFGTVAVLQRMGSRFNKRLRREG